MKKTKILLLGLIAFVALSTTVFAEDYSVKTSVLNVRSGASVNHAVIGKLNYGDIVNVSETTGPWAKIDLGGTEGFIHTNYIKSLTVVTPEVVSVIPGLSKENSDEIIDYAKKYLGYRYTYGGSTPKAGFDCGGLIKYVFNHYGASLTMGAKRQYNSITEVVNKSDLIKGDVVYFSSPKKKSIAHTGIYISDGKFIHASSPGDVVKIDTLLSGYYSKYYYGAKRILK